MRPGWGFRRPWPGWQIDRAGNVFVTDRSNNQVIQITVDGRIERIAGNGTRSVSGDGGPALLAGMRDPGPIVADARFGIFVASNTLIRRIAPRRDRFPCWPGPAEPGSADDPEAVGQARLQRDIRTCPGRERRPLCGRPRQQPDPAGRRRRRGDDIRRDGRAGDREATAAPPTLPGSTAPPTWRSRPREPFT